VADRKGRAHATGQNIIQISANGRIILELAVSRLVTWKRDFQNEMLFYPYVTWRPSSGAPVGYPANSLQRTQNGRYINNN
jgi:hypothetical protein